MKPKLKTALLTGGMLLLAGANVWAATSIAAIDAPVTAGANVIQNSMAFLMGCAGIAYGGYEIAFNRHIATGLTAAGCGLTGAAMTHNGGTISGAVGGATAALVHIPHHAHVIASIAHRLLA